MPNNHNIITHYSNSTRKINHVHPRYTAACFWLLVGIFALAIHVGSVSIPKGSIQAKSRMPISLEEAFLGELRAKDFDFDWLSSRGSADIEGHDQLIYEESKNILLVDLPSIERKNNSLPGNLSGYASKSGSPSSNFNPNVSVLVSNASLLATVEFQGYKLSPSKRYLLLWNSRRKQFRHSFTAKYFLYDIQTDSVALLSTRQTPSHYLSNPVDTFIDERDESMRFKVVDWYSTDVAGDSVDSLIMIQNNDIYKLYDVSRLAYKEDDSHSTKSRREISQNSVPIRLTTTGRDGVVFNGVPDWLYEEEILGDTPAFQVSPMSSHLAYMSFDDQYVNIMPYTIYGDHIIPRIQLIRYPKTGQPNPIASVHVIENFSGLSEDQVQRNSIQMVLPGQLEHDQHYINRITWLTDEKLALIWSNRNQNNSFIVICSKSPLRSGNNPNGWSCEKNLDMKVSGGWLDISDDLLPLNADYYLALLPKYEGPTLGNFKHIAMVSIKEPNRFIYLTSGPKEVVSFNGIDYKRSLVYYTSTVTDEPGKRQLFVTELDSKSVQPVSATNVLGTSSVCVTCDHHPEDCQYNLVKMSPSTNYYMFHCSGPGVPRVELRSTRRRRHRNFFENLVNDTRQRKLIDHTDRIETNLTVNDNLTIQNSSSLLWTYEDNKKLRDKLENQKLMPMTLRLAVPIPDTDYQADVLLLIPPHLVPVEQSTGQKRASSSYLTIDQVKELFPVELNGQKMPLIVDVYGGPGSQKVDYRFNVNFGHYLATSKQVVYASIDGRGSGYRGTKRLYELYHRLGSVEIQDQIDVASYLARSLWFIDSSKMAIWGWSYGGYAAAMSLAQSKARVKSRPLNGTKMLTNGTSSNPLFDAIFKCAASVAPVTNWIYYDTAYTEKFMSSPWRNEKYDNLYPGDHLLDNEASNVQSMTQLTNGKSDSLTPNKWTHLNKTLGSKHIQPHTTQHLLDLVADVEGRRKSPLQQHANINMNDLNDRYGNASLLEQAINFESNNYLLIHGTADDNVNFQQSIMFMKRLIRKNVLFETRLYPDQDHGIAEKADKLNLGATLSNFLIHCLG